LQKIYNKGALQLARVNKRELRLKKRVTQWGEVSYLLDWKPHQASFEFSAYAV